MASAPALTRLRPQAGVDLSLTPEAILRLQALDALLGRAGVPSATITSGRRSGSVPSAHNSGEAIDLVAPGGSMAELADYLASQGYTAAFERKGQVNANGSVATGDHIHVTLRGAADPYAAYRGGATPSASPAPAADPYALYRGRPPRASDPYALYRQPTVAPAAAKPPSPGTGPSGSIPSRIGQGVLDALTTGYRGMTGFYNEAASQGAAVGTAAAQRPPSVTEMLSAPGYFLAHAPAAFLESLKAGAQAALHPGQPLEGRALRTALRRTPGNTDPNLYGALAVLDQLLPLAGDPSGELIGKGTSALAAKVRALPVAQKAASALRAVPGVAKAEQVLTTPLFQRASASLGVGPAANAIRQTFEKPDLQYANRVLKLGRVVQRVQQAEQQLQMRSPAYEGASHLYRAEGKGFSPLQDLVKQIVRDDAVRPPRADARGLAMRAGQPEAGTALAREGQVPPGPKALPAGTPYSKYQAFADEQHIPLETAMELASQLSREYERGIRFLQSTGARGPGQNVRTEYVGLGGKIRFDKNPVQVARQRSFLRRREVDQFLSEVFGPVSRGTDLNQPGQTAFAGRDVTLFQKAHLRDAINRLQAAGIHAKPIPENALPAQLGGPGFNPIEPGFEAVPQARVFTTLSGKQVYRPVLNEIKARMRDIGYGTFKTTKAIAGPESGAGGVRQAALWLASHVASRVKKFMVSNVPTLDRNLGQNVTGGMLAQALHGRPVTEFLAKLPEGFAQAIDYAKGYPSDAVRRIEQRSQVLGQTYAQTVSVAGSRSAADVAGVAGRVARPAGGVSPAGLYAAVAGEPVWVPNSDGVRRIVGNLGVTPNELTDRAAKIALFETLEPHLGTDAAVREVETFLFNPGRRSGFFRALDSLGILPFNYYLGAGARLGGKVALERPDIPARGLAVRNQIATAMGAQENKDNVPEGHNRYGVIPIGPRRGLDLTGFTPLRDAAEALQISQGLGNPAAALFQNSLLRPLGELAFNRQMFNGEADRELVPRGLAPGIGKLIRAKQFLFGYSPGMVRGAFDFGNALQGIGKPGRSGEPERPVDAALRGFLGLPIVKLETPAEKMARTAGAQDYRALLADPIVAKAEQALIDHPERNPYRNTFAGETNGAALGSLLQDAQKQLKAVILNAANVGRGGLTSGGKKAISEQLAYVYAIANRLDELGQ